MRWEKTRLPSALSQIVNAPLNAVRGTLQQVYICIYIWPYLLGLGLYAVYRVIYIVILYILLYILYTLFVLYTLYTEYT